MHGFRRYAGNNPDRSSSGDRILVAQRGANSIGVVRLGMS